MERTKFILRIPDAINCGVIKEYTQIPTDLIRNPNISAKAKTVLCLLLSNKKGWHSYISTLQQMMKEGKDSVSSAVKELESNGYLLRIRYRSESTKAFIGSFWAYTDDRYHFRILPQVLLLIKNHYEVIIKLPEEMKEHTPYMAFPDMAEPEMENQALKILNIKNILIIKKTNSGVSFKEPTGELPLLEENLPVNKNELYLPIARYLATTIKLNKNITIPSSSMNKWAEEIGRLSKGNQIDLQRIKNALKWYRKHIGGEYIPVIESGRSLRDKFMKLEAAMERQKNNPSVNTSGSLQGKAANQNYYKPEIIIK